MSRDTLSVDDGAHVQSGARELAMTKRRFGVLSTYDTPTLGHLLAALRKRGAVPTALILDSTRMSEKGERIHLERTGGQMPWRPLHEEATGLPVYFVESHKDASTVALTRALSLDFLVNGGTPRILNAPILSSTELGVINCHPGKLPDYRGCTCPEWSILNDDLVFNTVHQTTVGIDEGPILMMEEVSFPKECSYQDMRLAVYRQGMDLLAAACHGLQAHALGASSFSEQGSGTYHKPISDERLREVVSKLERGLYNPARPRLVEP